MFLETRWDVSPSTGWNAYSQGWALMRHFRASDTSPEHNWEETQLTKFKSSKSFLISLHFLKTQIGEAKLDNILSLLERKGCVCDPAVQHWKENTSKCERPWYFTYKYALNPIAVLVQKSGMITLILSRNTLENKCWSRQRNDAYRQWLMDWISSGFYWLSNKGCLGIFVSEKINIIYSCTSVKRRFSP